MNRALQGIVLAGLSAAALGMAMDFAGALPMPTGLGPNIIANPGFEAQGALGPSDPAQWSRYTGIPDVENYIFRTDSEAFEGTHSLELYTYDGHAATVRASANYAPIHYGGTYRLEFEWMHNEADPNVLKVYRVVQDEVSGNPLYFEVGSQTIGETAMGWQHITITGIPTTFAYLSRMSVAVGIEDPGAANRVWVDDVKLREELPGRPGGIAK